MPEECPSRRAPSCADTGLPGLESTHHESLSPPAQAPTGTHSVAPGSEVLQHVLSLWLPASSVLMSAANHIFIQGGKKSVVFSLLHGFKLNVKS